tara:strand:- start:450 stop:1316 length:867 start_codon:yes stop_codon:yes gene_type:complete
MNKIPFFFSIDFEDYYHDKKRQLGHKNPTVLEAPLWKSYEKIQILSKNFFNGKKITFFTTGVVARSVPDLLAQIAKDGHEVGCHYNFHDSIHSSNKEDFKKNLDIAIESIYKATGTLPKGFRAPNFDIKPEDNWAFEEISKRFDYDSSYITKDSLNDILPEKKFKFGNNSLYEFFVFSKPVLGSKFSLRSGGTFLRLFPTIFTINTMKETYRKGHMPLLYMHPYEFLNDYEFWVPWKDFINLSLPKRLYKWSRQIQWLKVGNKNVFKKLNKILSIFEHQGPMKTVLDI